MKVQVVIGANFGDEGKGLVTSTLACRHPNKTVVVRYSGGGQAGHTVEMKDGIKHVFSTFGAGTFSDAPTYLSRHFIFNPMQFLLENQRLFDKNWIPPTIIIHPDAVITTPFDVMVNWAVENKRRVNSVVHGSCGLGINETVERSLTLPVTVSDLADLKTLRQKLIAIRDDYFPARIESLECGDFVDEAWADEDTLDSYLAFCREANLRIIKADTAHLNHYEVVIFEGAQGLMLDQNHYMFPHVTRSNTGLTNVEDILTELGYKGRVEVFYVTRSYLTRHGEGPLPYECEGLLYPHLGDATNVDNLFQGKLRYAPFNLSLLLESVITDLKESTLAVDPMLVVTCVNQLPEHVAFVTHYGTLERTTKEKLLKELQNHNNPWSRVLLSYSPVTTANRFLEQLK